MIRRDPKVALAGMALALVIWGAYANHFQNGFHFDDHHTIVNNAAAIGDLRNVPRFFTDARLSSTMPDHYTYRPVVAATLAFDYWLGRGLHPFWFHVSTFAWYLGQLALMYFLFRRVMDAAGERAGNAWTALAATAFYALHPANAETVNYVIQRAEVYATAGVVASLLAFSAWPAARGAGLYLLPALVAYLAKPPALIFPLLLLAYVVLIEDKSWRDAWRATRLAFLVTAAAAVLIVRMTPPTFNAGAASPLLYRLTQPWVALHYFKSFFFPTELSADSDWTYVSGWSSTQAVLGYLFVAGLGVVAWRAARRRETRPVAFGIVWFVAALLPTSLMPLAEVANDHRMFFAFVGLSLAVFWALRLRVAPRWSRVAAAAAILVLAAAAVGTRARNEVWRSEESLWRDVTGKSPRNGRGWMNYGLVFMERGDYNTALADFNRALLYTPDYYVLEINLGIAYGGLRQDDEAERHFQRAIALAPASSEPRFYYDRWLRSIGRAAGK